MAAARLQEAEFLFHQEQYGISPHGHTLRMPDAQQYGAYSWHSESSG